VQDSSLKNLFKRGKKRKKKVLYIYIHILIRKYTTPYYHSFETVKKEVEGKRKGGKKIGGLQIKILTYHLI